MPAARAGRRRRARSAAASAPSSRRSSSCPSAPSRRTARCTTPTPATTRRRRRSSGSTRSSGAGASSRRCWRGARSASIARPRSRYYERRAALMTDRIGDHAGAAAVLRQLRKMHPEDDAIAARLERALGRAGPRRRAGRGACARACAQPSAAARARPSWRACTSSSARSRRSSATRRRRSAPSSTRSSCRPRIRARWPSWPSCARAAPTGTATRRRASARRRWRRRRRRRWRALVDAARVHIERRKDDQAAKRALERALQKDPDAPEAVALYGSLARRLLDDTTADALALKELHGAPAPSPERQAELHAGLGASALRRGDTDEAARRFREAVAAQAGLSAGHPGAGRSGGAVGRVGRGGGAVARRGVARRRAAAGGGAVPSPARRRCRAAGAARRCLSGAARGRSA